MFFHCHSIMRPSRECFSKWLGTHVEEGSSIMLPAFVYESIMWNCHDNNVYCFSVVKKPVTLS